MKSSGKFTAAVVALSGILMVGTASFTSAAPNKKGGKAPTKTAASGSAAGAKVFAAQNCGACHTIAGKGGKSGPDLSHEGKAHNAAWIDKFVRNPKSVHPKSTMPAYGPEKINAKDMKALDAYLAGMK